MDRNKAIAAALFAAWLADQHPELFARLQAQASGTAAPVPGLAGFTDTLSSIWGGITNAAAKVASGLGTAVQSVGTYLGTAQGQSALASLATAYYGNKAAKSVIQAQAQRAAAGQTPAPIETIYDPGSGTYVPVMTQATPTGIVSTPVTPYTLQSLQPNPLQQYLPWIIGGGVALIALVMLSRNRN